MANHKSALKRVKQNRKKYLRNRAYRTMLKNILKNARSAVNLKTNDDLIYQVKEAEKLINKIKSKGIIHRNKASRLVSRLAKAANKKLKQASVS